MTNPEAQARVAIDRLLELAGWVIQDYNAIDLWAGLGVAVREFQLDTGAADYLLFVEGRAAGVVEAKKAGTPLSGVEAQSAKYSTGLPQRLKAWRRPLPFLYESTGVETFFTNGRDLEPRARRVFCFHRPETLRAWAEEPLSLRARLQALPPLLTGGLWPAQVEAITNLEASLAHDRPRALIQMATGSGKTFTAVSQIYRLIKHAGVRRVLFLVDRSNLGRQALREFQQYVTPDDGRKFTEIYNVQHLQSNTLDDVSRVCITTIQRLYAMLSDEELPAEQEELSYDEQEAQLGGAPRTVRYNPRIPVEYFDLIVADECHRSIYNLWRQVLEYFDAHLVGLTATPSAQTLVFFGNNLVMEYTRQRAVVDGVNVDGEVYRIRTAIGEGGSTVEAASWVTRRNRRTRMQRLEQLDEDFAYSPQQLDREVVAEDQIRTVVRTFRDRLFSEIFPGRSEVPKTLIFAKDDSHAEEIVRIVREEFGRGNEFCQKITYRVSGVRPEELIAAFRNSYNPRVAVTVDMIATGTDIRPLECLVFLRLVKSPGLFEQMQGRGTRVISPTDLQAVTSDARRKDRFVIVDCVGVVDHPRAETPTLERRRSVPLAQLFELAAQGVTDEDLVSSLAVRLARLHKTLGGPDHFLVQQASGGADLHALSQDMLAALDADRQIEAARSTSGRPDPSEAQIEAAADGLRARALRPLAANVPLRRLILDLQQRDEQLIDTVSLDVVREAGFTTDPSARARATVERFRLFLDRHRDELPALQILAGQPDAGQRLGFAQLKELAARLEQPPSGLTAELLWEAYARLHPERVRGAAAGRTPADLVALVRHALDPQGELVPYSEQVQARYSDWQARQAAAGRSFSADQRRWLDQIARQIAVNLSVESDDFEYGELFNRGGRFAAERAFGPALTTLLEELNRELA
ncbi:MAG TPA: DEAD/DEAH box helicase family protein [Roseiflexaceae bacterium]|nr:DEAD/DEAH box helicase family protein [Roseiflexaceae bacterium]